MPKSERPTTEPTSDHLKTSCACLSERYWGKTARFFAQFLAADGREMEPVLALNLERAEDWRQWEGEIAVPADATAIRMIVGLYHAAGTMDIDDIRVTTSAPMRDAPTRIQLNRRDRTLRQRPVAPIPPPRRFQVLAQRQGNDLTAQFDHEPAMQFSDGFAMPAANSKVLIQCGDGYRLTRLSVYRQNLPPIANALENGDLMFNRSDFGAALEFFETAAVASRNSVVRQEATYKKGVCQLALKRTKEALETFVQIFNEPGDRWPSLAGSQLWRTRLAENKMDEADVILQKLNARSHVEDLAVLLTESEQRMVWWIYMNHARFADALHGSSELAMRVERVGRVAELSDKLGASVREQHLILWHLARGRLALGQINEAERVSRSSLARVIGKNQDDLGVAIHCDLLTRIAIHRGEPQSAIPTLYQWAPRVKDVHQSAEIQRNKVQALAANDQWAEAERLLNEVRTSLQAHYDPNFRVTFGALLLGFLRDHRGDADGAVDAWRAAYQVVRSSRYIGNRFINPLR